MNERETSRVDLTNRKIYPSSWSLLSQWFCIPVDATPAEISEAIQMSKGSLGTWFENCPDEYITDRFYGGFPCEDPNRRHILFDTGAYSYIAAGEGQFWANTPEDRQEKWEELLAEFSEKWTRTGPWTDDAPTKERNQ